MKQVRSWLMGSMMMGMGMAAGCSTTPTGSALEPALPQSVTVKAVAAPIGRKTQPIRVMSLNLRVSTIFDLQNTWGLRRDLLAKVIKQFDPDLLGTQECLAQQADYLRRQLPGYQFVGIGRNDGRRAGEMCAIFFKRDRFELLDQGHFWLSRTPETPGSRSWFEILPRIVTWVELRPHTAGAKPFYFFDLHPDNFFQYARIKSMILLRRRLAAIVGDSPVLIAGDFNADEGSPSYRLMVGGPGVNGRKLLDTFRVANPNWVENDGTRSGFGGHRGGPRIDWILATPRFQTLYAGIDHAHAGWRYPSDHFPIVAVVALQPRSGRPVQKVVADETRALSKPVATDTKTTGRME